MGGVHAGRDKSERDLFVGEIVGEVRGEQGEYPE